MGSTGGNSLTEDVNSQYDLANMVWIMAASALVWVMIPGVGLLYSGLSRRKHGLSLIWSSMMAICLISFQWFFWGWSLTFSHEAGKFIGRLDNFAMMNVLAEPSVGSSAVPDILFMLYQGMFAIITGNLMIGGAHERAKLGPMMVYLFIWMTIVYAPIACWTWNPSGWLNQLGGLDFAGGGPVHMSSGAGALAYALICGKRKDPAADGIPTYKPHNIVNVFLGTVLLWFGWFGFNGGSSGNATIRGYYAAANTNLAAACGGLTWMFIDWFRKGHKWSTVALCSGSIAGLVGITPAAGFIPIYFAVPTGVLAAFAANFAVDLKHILRIDDGLDIFALHGVGGFVGSVCTGLFAADYVARLDGSTEIPGGWLNHHYVQLGYQLAGCCATLGWSFTISSIVLLIMNRIPYLKVRLTEEEEFEGTDAAQIGEVALFNDDLDTIMGTGPTPTPEKRSRANSSEMVTKPSTPIPEEV